MPHGRWAMLTVPPAADTHLVHLESVGYDRDYETITGREADPSWKGMDEGGHRHAAVLGEDGKVTYPGTSVHDEPCGCSAVNEPHTVPVRRCDLCGAEVRPRLREVTRDFLRGEQFEVRLDAVPMTTAWALGMRGSLAALPVLEAVQLRTLTRLPEPDEEPEYDGYGLDLTGVRLGPPEMVLSPHGAFHVTLTAREVSLVQRETVAAGSD